jgi:hypothetical protein
LVVQISGATCNSTTKQDQQIIQKWADNPPLSNLQFIAAISIPCGFVLLALYMSENIVETTTTIAAVFGIITGHTLILRHTLLCPLARSVASLLERPE